MTVRGSFSPMVKFGLQLLGIWPDVPFGLVRRAIHTSSIIIAQLCQYAYVYSHFNLNELETLIDSMAAVFYYGLTGMKALALWKYHGLLSELLAIMDNDWREVIEVDEHVHFMTASARNSKFWSYSLLIFNGLAAIVYFGGENLVVFARLLLGYNVTSRPFPIRTTFPFDAEQSPTYEILFIVLFLHSLSVTFTVNVVSALVITLVSHVCGKIDIINQELKNFCEKVPLEGSSRYTIKLLIEKHTDVISFTENLDKLFSFIVLMQVFGNTLVICFIGLVFLITDGYETDTLLKTFFAYTGITVEIFMFCYIGENLGVKNKSLAHAAYESLWYNMSPSNGRNILLIMLKSQKPLTITVGGITDLSLEAFTSIMKASASYMSVLNAMY